MISAFCRATSSGIVHNLRRMSSSVVTSHLKPDTTAIGTHNGKFHCDEVFACYMLKRLPEFQNHIILRTRDPNILADCQVIVDVGGVYNHSSLRYDHHQREFNESMKSLDFLDFCTKLSSAGLVYAHYGKRVIGALLGLPNGDPAIDILYRKVYECFVEAVDAIDNGVPAYDGVPRYQVHKGISGRIEHLNPAWNEDDVDPNERFAKAMCVVGEEFEERVNYLYKSWLPARDIVENALKRRTEYEPSGKVLVFESGSVPWKEHFFVLEEELGLKGDEIAYAVFGDRTNNDWRVQSIPVDALQQFENRLPLPAEWRGIRDAELSTLSGISECVFVHASGFIGGNKTKEGAIQMAVKSLKMAGRYNSVAQ
ncbi:hypothetical protein L596_011401 [Steinernema carpocapsae]|uniref:Uncharacterized protein n=1 Tax=Steinernema carpocapsae TaxID=34508 RepID=A0A4U5NUA0_STECR|nr:hypothetical protein L596_011401 [Steinernema carpocapsae]